MRRAILQHPPLVRGAGGYWYWGPGIPSTPPAAEPPLEPGDRAASCLARSGRREAWWAARCGAPCSSCCTSACCACGGRRWARSLTVVGDHFLGVGIFHLDVPARRRVETDLAASRSAAWTRALWPAPLRPPGDPRAVDGAAGCPQGNDASLLASGAGCPRTVEGTLGDRLLWRWPHRHQLVQVTEGADARRPLTTEGAGARVLAWSTSYAQDKVCELQ